MNSISRPNTFRFWGYYFIHMRPYLLFVSGAAGMAGVFAGNGSAAASLALFVPFFLAYGFGQALTDSFQTDTDRLSAPYRPLSRGVIAGSDVLVVSLAGLSVCGLLLVMVSFKNVVPALCSVAGLATYTYFKKNFWWAGPFYNAWIVALLPVMGMFSTDVPIVAPLIAMTFFSYANFVLMGYLKDITADATTGYHTFPVEFGWSLTVRMGNALGLVSLGLCYAIVNQSKTSMVILMAATFLTLAGQAHAYFVHPKTEANAAFSITSTVRNFILLHSAVAVHYQENAIAPVVIFYALFEIFLWRRPSKSQV